ncbi:MAG: hypothetical protein MRY32_04360 [Rickettsiales bacterium]|nr:hypothetical protein [Rickettsiales bacterium]
MDFKAFNKAAFPEQRDGPFLLYLRDYHYDKSNTDMLRENTELTRDAKVLLELPYVIFNPILHAHREGRIDDNTLRTVFRAVARDNLYRARGHAHPYELKQYEEAVRDTAEAIIELHRRTPPVIVEAIDSRGKTHLPPNREGILAAGVSPFYVEAIQLSQQLAKEYPQSIKHAPFIAASNADRVPNDITTATLVRHSLGVNGVGIMPFGLVHAAGIHIPHANMQGIVDDALQAQGVTVRDALIVANEEAVREITAFSTQAAKVMSKSYHVSHLYRPHLSSDALDLLYLYRDGRALTDAKAMQAAGYVDPIIHHDDQALDPRQLKAASAEEIWGAGPLRNAKGERYITAAAAFFDRFHDVEALKETIDQWSASIEDGPLTTSRAMAPALGNIPGARRDTAMLTQPHPFTKAQDKGGGRDGP